MKLPLLPILAAAVLALYAGAVGKPPLAKPDAHPSPTPTAPAADGSSAPLLRWLLLQNGGPAAAAVSFPDIVRVVNGHQIVPLDAGNAPDAAILAQLGAVLDTLLPRLNRPDGALRTVPALTSLEATTRVADELRGALDGKAEAVTTADALCPVLHWTETPGGRTCHLAVATYPTGGKDGSLRALSLRAADLAGQITTDGPCLVVGVEHNGKTGRDLALLNWELIDLSRVSLRCALTFETDADGLHVSGATLGDGRRGRD